jgi:hypothetical protein
MGVFMRIRILLLAILLAALSVEPAAAATFNVTFSATNFTGQPDGSPNPATVEGSFQVTFDPSQDYVDETAGITVNALNLTVDSPFAFYYVHDSSSFQIGGLDYGVSGVVLGHNDFLLTIEHFTAGPLHSEMFYALYSQTALGVRYFITPDSLGHPTDNPNGYARVTATPLPGSLPLLLTAVAGLAVARQRRRSA